MLNPDHSLTTTVASDPISKDMCLQILRSVQFEHGSLNCVERDTIVIPFNKEPIWELRK